MDIAIISFIILGVVAVAIVSFIAGKKRAEIDIALITADLNGQKLARKELSRKYDELYDAFLRLNQYNTELTKENYSLKNTYAEAGDEVYALFCEGKSRQEICKLYPNVAYSTLCNWIRRKRNEGLSLEVNPNDSVQGKLL